MQMPESLYLLKMRALLLLIFALAVAFPHLALAGEQSAKAKAEALMAEGNKDYQSQKYDSAVTAYHKVLDLGYIGTSVYYNIGDAYYREGKLGYAILYYEKALKLSPGDNDVIHNLEIANARTIDKVNTLPPFFLFQWWESFLGLLTVNGWTYTAYICLLLVLGSILLYFFAKRPGVQRASVFSGFISILLLVFTASVVAVTVNRALNVKYGVIVSPVVSVKLSPDQTSNDAFIVHEGLKVRELEQVGNWIEVRLADGKEGWVLQSEVGTI